MTDKKIEALINSAEKKKQEAATKTEKAIKTLIEKKDKITIRSVAKEAGVSVGYIYKYPELAHRIQTLREQQKYYPVKPQSPSSKSHQVITIQLRNRIKILEQEKEELTKEMKILAANVYEMTKSENSVERLKAENIKLKEEINNLKRQLRHIQKELTESRDFILQQGYNKKYEAVDLQSKEQMNKKQQNSNKVIQLIPEEKAYTLDILPIKSPIEMDKEIETLLSELGIKLSRTLIEEIKSKPKDQVIGAISVVQENIDTGVKIRSKVGLFRSALKEEWTANQLRTERNSEQNMDEFSEWFDLAKEQGVVQKCKMTDEGILVLKPGDGWIQFENLVEKGWTLNYLKNKKSK